MTTTAKLTLEQFLSLPETEPVSEHVDGEVIQKQMPTIIHMLLQAFLSETLRGFIRGKRLGVAGSEPR